ncbi:MAG: cohesin domain-containing protein, partial [Blastocatellia bacterium]
LNQSVEDVVNRAQVEEEQERRLIAQGTPGVQLDAPAPAQPANFNNPQRPGVGSQRPAIGSQPVVQPVGNPNNRTQRVINNGSLSAPPPSSGNQSASVPEVPETAIPDIPVNPNTGNTGSDNPQQQPSGQSARQSGQEAGKDGGTPDLSQFISQPAEPVPPATVVASRRPENVDRAITRMLAEENARKASEAANRSKKPEPQPEFPKEYLTPGPQQKVAQATPKAGGNTRANSAVNLSLSPKPIRGKIGKKFTVTVEVSSQAQMSGADIELKYDASKLEVKSVRDGGMFGAQPEFGYDLNKQKGILTVNVKQPQNTPTAANGRLITIEFSAIGEGQSEIAFNTNETKVRVGSAQIPAAGSATQVIIGRDSVATSNEK